MKIFIILSLLLSSITFADDRLDSLLFSTVNDIYSIKFESAEKTIKIVKTEYPQHPASLFFDAMIYWWKIQLDQKNEQYDEVFYKKADAVLDLCEKILDKDENNRDANFYHGGALGFKARVQTFRKDWLKAALNGKNAIPFVHNVYELDTLNKDALLGLGIYNYFADVIPKKHSFVKPFMAFFPKGDAKKGLKELTIASQHGKFAKYEARYQLIMLYYYYEKNYKEGYKHAKYLVEEFPNNPIFQKFYIRFAYKINKFNEVDKMLENALNNHKKGVIGYNPRTMVEFYYYGGLSNFRQRKYATATDFNIKSIETNKTIIDFENSFYYPNAMFNQGMVFYNSKEYNEAKKYFNNVLNTKNIGNTRSRAKEMLERIAKKKKM